MSRSFPLKKDARTFFPIRTVVSRGEVVPGFTPVFLAEILHKGNVFFEEDIWMYYKQCKQLPSTVEKGRETHLSSLHEKWQIFWMFSSALPDLISQGKILALQKPTAKLLPAPTKLSRCRTPQCSCSVLWSEVCGGFSSGHISCQVSELIRPLSLH